jgi:hypothetical protein
VRKKKFGDYKVTALSFGPCTWCTWCKQQSFKLSGTVVLLHWGKLNMSNRSTTASDSADSVQDAGDETAYMKMVEAGHIGFQLAEEVRTLRESILALKQEKRLLLVNNENLEECVAQSNTVISSLRAKVEEQHRYIEAYSSEASQQVLQNLHWI